MVCDGKEANLAPLARLLILSTIAMASGPLMRRSAMAPGPCGVQSETIVCSSCEYKITSDLTHLFTVQNNLQVLQVALKFVSQ